jgi:hypothetical protein
MKRMAVVYLFGAVLLGCQNQGLETRCSTFATLHDMTGLDGCGFVFELEDGTILEPVRIFRCGTPPAPDEGRVPSDPLEDFEWVDGKQVFLDYELLEESASICMMGKPARITCIQEAVALPTGE